MIRKCSRMCLVLVLAWTSFGMLWFALTTSAGTAEWFPARQGSDIITPTHLVHLPLIRVERASTNPPSGTVMIAGQATIHGQPAQPEVPFSLWYRHWELRPYPVITVTTYSDGSFYFGPIKALPYCYAIWYTVNFDRAASPLPDDDYAERWTSNPIFACQSGQVYTVSAEIGRQ